MSNEIQVINGDGVFDADLHRRLAEIGFTSKGLDYHVVSVLGCQSSGKSTLLNLLFDTKFITMNAEVGRQQTTLGIWLGYHQQNGILVFDVEGTDSKERGEENAAFERKTSLFSMALSELLIINMWNSDLGRYNASNYALLKAVFEAHLKLFQKDKKHKTLLLFVIRDRGNSPLIKIEEMLVKDMDKNWADLIKPDNFKNSKFSDFFDYTFVALPHKELQTDLFFAEVADLRKRFYEPKRSDFIFEQRYHGDIPADGYAHYLASIWEIIQADRDLDLPTQKEMLAMFRCEEIAAGLFEQFQQALEPVRISLRAGQTIANFGADHERLCNQLLDEFDRETHLYLETVVQRKRSELQTKMHNELHSLFLTLLSRLVAQANTQLSERLKRDFPEQETPVENFKALADAIRQDIIAGFKRQADESLVASARPIWSYDSELIDLRNNVDSRLLQERQTQLKRLQQTVEKKLKVLLVEPILSALESGQSTMWQQIGETHETAKEKSAQLIRSKADEFGLDATQLDDLLRANERTVRKLLLDTARVKEDDLFAKLKHLFELKFRYDERNLPRRWQPNDDIPTKYQQAFDNTVTLIEMYAKIPIVQPEEEVLTPRQCAKLQERFKAEADMIYMQARDEQERLSTRAHVPTFLIILLIIFGFDNVWPWVSNPFYFMLLLFFGGIGFVVWYLGLHQNPVVHAMASTAYGKSQEMLAQKIRSFGASKTSDKPKTD